MSANNDYNNYEESDKEESSSSFARRYRPSSFDGYIGNSDVKETIMRYLRNKRRPQTILIHGNSGCGKTTLGRIIEREYRCENRDPEKGACGECYSCQQFESYIKTGVADDLADVYEIDASDSSGKKDVNVLLESMEYPAISGDWKVYMLDEVHLLSEGAMGRLLKSLEEPPEGILILLCTTNPEKLLDTIRNRCEVKCPIIKPTTVELTNHLQRICINEGKKYDLQGLRMIVGRNENVIRDSLNDLETILNTRGDATALSVSTQFHQVTDKVVFDFYKAYFNEDYVEYINILYRIKTEFNFSQFISTLTSFTTRGLYILNSIEVDGLTKEEISETLELFSKFSPRDISRILRELRRMSLGNIEANLMAFIYCRFDEENTSTEKESKVVINETTSIAAEHVQRNNNLQALEHAKLSRGESEILKETRQVKLSDMSSMFNLEKVGES